MPADSMAACLVLALAVAAAYVRAAPEGACCSTVGIMGICETTSEPICDMCLGDYLGDATDCGTIDCLAQCSVDDDCIAAIPVLPGVCSEPKCVSGYCSRSPLSGVCSLAQGTQCSRTSDCPETGGSCVCDYYESTCCIACSGGGAICDRVDSVNCTTGYGSTLCPGAEVAVDVIRSLDQSCSPGTCTGPLTNVATSCGPNVPDSYGMCSESTLALKIAPEYTLPSECTSTAKCCSEDSPGTCNHSPWDLRCCPSGDTVVIDPLYPVCTPSTDMDCCYAGGVRVSSPDEDCCPATGGVLVGIAEQCPEVCVSAEDCGSITPDNCTMWSCINNACINQGVATGRCTEAQTVSCDSDYECSSEGLGSCACGSDSLTCCYQCLDQFGNVYDTVCSASTVTGCNTQAGISNCGLATGVNFAFSLSPAPPGACDAEASGCFDIFNEDSKRGRCSSSECSDEFPIDYPSTELLPTTCVQNTTCCLTDGTCVSGNSASDASCCAGISIPYTVPCASNKKCCFGTEPSSFIASEECCIAAGGVPQAVATPCQEVPALEEFQEAQEAEVVADPLCRVMCGEYPESIDVCFTGSERHCIETRTGMGMIMDVQCSMDVSVEGSCAVDFPDSIDCGDRPCELSHSSNDDGGIAIDHTSGTSSVSPAYVASMVLIPIAIHAFPN